MGVGEDLIASNPCKGIPRNATTNRDRVLSNSEIAPFWQALEKGNPIKAAALKMILLTVQRPGEVRHMRHEHIRDCWWDMPGNPAPVLGWPGTKNGKNHRVWLPPPAQAIIAEISEEGLGAGFVFPSARGRPIFDLHKLATEVCNKLCIEPVRPHDLRRTHGSTITALGFARDALNRIQNHIEGGIADVYDQHKYADENQRIMEAVAARIMSLVQRRDDANMVTFTG
jgi:integrase